MWTSDIQSIVFTRIKAEATKQLKNKYPNIFFGTSDRASKEPQFPSVYVKRMQGSERGRTLEGSDMNAILSTYQIEVNDNVSENRAQEVADVILDIMKSMSYEVVGEPVSDNTEDTYRNIARYRRIIGASDIL